MGRIAKYTRRGFLGLGAAAIGGLAVGYYYYKKPFPNPLEGMVGAGESTFNPYVIIGADNTITIYVPRAEMGQGIHTTLAALVAEELDVDFNEITVTQSPTAPAYYNEAQLREGAPFAPYDDGFLAESARNVFGAMGKFVALQSTGGSSATIDAYVKLRESGAAARLVLVQAAAARWGVGVDRLTTGGAMVHHPDGRSLTYGELAQDAAKLDAPSAPDLKPKSDWKLLGKSQKRVEILDKVTGGRIYGIDMQLPGMLYGTVVMSPRFGVGAVSADKAAALAVDGVTQVVDIETTTGKGFGIIATHTWAAFQGAQALAPVWEDAPYPPDSAGLMAMYDAALDAKASFTLGGNGDAAKALQSAPESDVFRAEYTVPYLAHSTMEPLNATAQFSDGQLTVWIGTQAPGVAQMRCADLLGIETDKVTVHTLRMGGGFGRRGEVDVPLYAAALAAKTGGKPIKVTWTREEDTRHDTYRPMAKGRFAAQLAPKQTHAALPRAIDVAVAAPSIVASLLTRTFPGIPAAGSDRSILDGAFGQPISWQDSRYSAHQVEAPVPVGFWRSVGNSVNGFFHETFMDEVAHQSGLSPISMRLRMLHDPRFLPANEIMTKVAEISRWREPLPDGVGQGFAMTLSFGTWVAEVVQVDMRDGPVKITNVWAVADPGQVLDPANFKTQIVSGIIYGLSAAMMQEITFANGQVQQGNFDDYDAMRMAQCPEIEVELLENAAKLGGAGEPGTPPAAAALGNAIFAASGQRLRDLPFGNTVDFY